MIKNNYTRNERIKELIKEFVFLSDSKGPFIESDTYAELLETIDTLLKELKSFEEGDSSVLDEKINEVKQLTLKHKELSSKSEFYHFMNNEYFKLESDDTQDEQLIKDIVIFQIELDKFIESLKSLLKEKYYNSINTENKDSEDVRLEQKRDTDGEQITPEIEKSSFHEMKKIKKKNKDIYDVRYIHDLKRFNKYYKVSINNQDFIFTDIIKDKELGENGILVCNDNYYASIYLYNNSLYYVTVYRNPENESQIIEVIFELSLSDSKEKTLTFIYDKEEYSRLVSEVCSREENGNWHVSFRRNPQDNKQINIIDIYYASKEDYIMGREPIKIKVKVELFNRIEKEFEFELLRNGRYRRIGYEYDDIKKDVSYQFEYTLEYVLDECKKMFNYLHEKKYDLLEAQNLNRDVVQSGVNKFMPEEVYYILSQIHPEYAEKIRRNAGEEQQNDEGFSVDRRSMPSISNGQRRLDFEKSLQANINTVLRYMTEYEKKQFIDLTRTLGFKIENYDRYYIEKDEFGECKIADRTRKEESKDTDTIIVTQDDKCYRISFNKDKINYEEHSPTDSRDLIIKTRVNSENRTPYIILKKYVEGVTIEYHINKEDKNVGITENFSEIIIKDNQRKIVYAKNENGYISTREYHLIEGKWVEIISIADHYDSYRLALALNASQKFNRHYYDIVLSDEDIEIIKKGKEAISERIPKIYRRIHPENAVIINRLDKETNKMELDGTR